MSAVALSSSHLPYKCPHRLLLGPCRQKSPPLNVTIGIDDLLFVAKPNTNYIPQNTQKPVYRRLKQAYSQNRGRPAGLNDINQVEGKQEMLIVCIRTRTHRRRAASCSNFSSGSREWAASLSFDARAAALPIGSGFSSRIYTLQV